jgi:hypothetical protein
MEPHIIYIVHKKIEAIYDWWQSFDDLKQTKSQTDGQYMIDATKDRHDWHN